MSEVISCPYCEVQVSYERSDLYGLSGLMKQCSSGHSFRLVMKIDGNVVAEMFEGSETGPESAPIKYDD